MGRIAIGAASLTMILPLFSVAASSAARAEIKAEIRGDKVVYSSRPRQKPGATAVRTRTRGPLDDAPAPIAGLVSEISARHGMDPDLIAAVVSAESAFNPLAVSPKGARGLMQLMPETARLYGVKDIHDPRQNLEGGIAYLKELVGRYRGNLTLALAAYNAGPGAVQRAAGVPEYRETQDYIRKIESRYGPLKGSAAAMEDIAGGPTPFSASIRPAQDTEGGVLWTNRPPRQKRDGRVVRK
jgi:hypothetical protein